MKFQEKSHSILVTGKPGIGKSHIIQQWAKEWNLPLKPIRLVDIMKTKEWSSGIFRVFVEIKSDCIVHIESLESLFPVLREDIYGALMLGYTFIKHKFNVILIAESLEIPKDPIRCLFEHQYKVPEITLGITELNLVLDRFGLELEGIQRDVLLKRLGQFTYRDWKYVSTRIDTHETLSFEQLKSILYDIPMKSFKSIQVQSTTFNDIAGYQHVKTLLHRIISTMKYPEKLKRFGIKPSIGALLYGPPGTGKTMIARAMAQESGAHFQAISIPDIIRAQVGESEKAIASVFEKAKQDTPSVIFIDEIESLFMKQGSVTTQLFAQLISELDDISLHDHRVLLLAATNHIDLIDRDLLRSGRIDQFIHVPLPSLQDRIEILTLLLTTRKPHSVDIDQAAKLTESKTGSEIKEIVRRALLKSVDQEILTNADFLFAINS